MKQLPYKPKQASKESNKFLTPILNFFFKFYRLFLFEKNHSNIYKALIYLKNMSFLLFRAQFKQGLEGREPYCLIY